MSNFVLLIAALAMVSMAAADGDYNIGKIHLLEKSYWYECEGDACEFKKCIVEYNQAGNGPEKCIEPKALYEFHKDSPEKLEERNCYDIRKTYYEDDYKDKANIIDCYASETVTPALSGGKKSICNVEGKSASHYYDFGFYKCENGDDFILQGCDFGSEDGTDNKCLDYSKTQQEVDKKADLQTILTDIETETKEGRTPRAACYELGQNDHFKTAVTKQACNFKITDPSTDFKEAIEKVRIAEETTTTEAPTTTTVPDTTTTVVETTRVNLKGPSADQIAAALSQTAKPLSDDVEYYEES